MTTNACGGCQTLAVAPGTACGPCGLDVFVCDGVDHVTCTDTAAGRACLAVCGDGLCDPALEDCGGCPADCGLCAGSCQDPACGLAPPDPALVAPPLTETSQGDFAAAVDFLFTGPTPIQQNADAQALTPNRRALLRGRVLTTDGQPRVGVRVSVVGHPESGFTLSRTSGWFDLVVNGGGPVLLEYARAGFLTVHRTTTVAWGSVAVLPDVVLLPASAQSTLVAFEPTSASQTALGDIQTDADGTRQAGVFFPAGTLATQVMPDGSNTALTQGHVRITEYTVGPRGPQQMPAVLPTASGYTYAVELAVDEAEAAGAASVVFSSAAVVHVDNFLQFPVGGAVPAGFYDRRLASWVAQGNGRVLGVVDNTGGLAQLDEDGDGMADAVSTLGIGDDERSAIAARFAPGSSLWRVPVPHFSTWDFNWPFGPPDGAEQPGAPNAPQVWGFTPCPEQGSELGCRDQTVAENIPVAGTPFALRYHSARMPGRKSGRKLNLTVTPSTLSPLVQRVEVEVIVAGRVFRTSLAPAPDQVVTLTWDGMDSFGRPAQGVLDARVGVGWTYQGVYKEPAGADAFGKYSGVPITGSKTRESVTLWRYTQVSLGQVDHRQDGLGGFNLDVHHRLLPASQDLLEGTGRVRQGALIPTVKRLLGHGTQEPVTGGLGSQTAMAGPQGRLENLAVMADGSILFSYGSIGPHRVFRMFPDGHLQHVAGGGPNVPGRGDNGLATAAFVDFVTNISVGPDGSIYLAEANFYLRRIKPDGTIVTVVGNGTRTFVDGVPGNQSGMTVFCSAVAPDGTVYVGGESRLVRLDPDGRVFSMAGSDVVPGSTPNTPVPLAAAPVRDIWGIALAPNGVLYFSESSYHRVRMLGLDGMVTTVAGVGGNLSYQGRFQGDGEPAVMAHLKRPGQLALDAMGGLYIADMGNNAVRYMDAQGIMHTAAGRVEDVVAVCPPVTDGASGPGSCLTLLVNAALGPDGTLHFRWFGGFARLGSPLPTLPAGQFVVPSQDGTQLHLLNGAGRHLRTVDAYTGATRLDFAYDAAGRLTAVTDVDGRITQLERDGQGVLTAVVAPGGQRTSIAVDANGMVAGVTSPEGKTWSFTYQDAGGLLSSMTAPDGTHTYAYDADGNLARATPPSGRTVDMTSQNGGTMRSVTVTTAPNRTTVYTESLVTGERTRTDPNGALTILRRLSADRTELRLPDGTIITQRRAPHPRFGMLAPVVGQQVTRLPSGKTSTITATRTVTLSDPANLLSLLSENETVDVDGRAYTSTYDAATRTWTHTGPRGSVQSFTADTLGRLLSVQPYVGADPITVTRNGLGDIASLTQGAQSLALTYDAQNHIETVTNAGGDAHAYTWTADEHVSSVVAPGNLLFGFSRNPDGTLAAMTLPGGAVHTVTGNARGMLTTHAAPGMPPQVRAYGPGGELQTATLPGGRVVQYTFDDGNRPLTVSSPEALVSFNYSAVGGRQRIGTVTRTEIPAGDSQTLTQGYDGKVMTAQSYAGAATADFTYAIGPSFRPTRVDFASGADMLSTPLTWQDGLLVGYGDVAITRVAGSPYATQLGDGTGLLAFTHNAAGVPTQRALSIGGVPRHTNSILLDDTGHVTMRTDTLDGVTRVFTYQYDASLRLTQVDLDGVTVETYTYDGRGNRTLAVRDGVNSIMDYDPRDGIVTQGPLPHTVDVDGFVVARGTAVLTWGARGELLNVSQPQPVRYVHDGVGRRTAAITAQGTTQYFYGHPWQPLAVTHVREADGTLVRFFHDDDGRLFAMERAGTRYYVATDHLGTPRAVLDAAGNLMKVLDHDSFGRLTMDTNPTLELHVDFAGGIRDPVTGFVRFGVRDYDPETGRFLSPDPLLLRSGQPNFYVYAGNDPVSASDPTGMLQVGFSAYAGVGAGGNIFITPQGIGACVEAGFGVGGGLGVDPMARLPARPARFVADLSLGLGPLTRKLGGELTDCGPALINGASVGPFNYDRNSGAWVNGFNPANDAAGVGVSPDTFNLEVAVQGRVAAEVCQAVSADALQAWWQQQWSMMGL